MNRRRRQPLGRTRQLQEREQYRAWYEQEYEERRRRRSKKRSLKPLWIVISVISALGIAFSAALVLPQLTGVPLPGVGQLAFADRALVVRDRAAEERLAAQKREALQYETQPGAETVSAEPVAQRAGAVTEAPAAESSVLVAYKGRFGPGWFIDGVDLSGMTKAEARAAVEAVPADGGGTFAVTVSVDGAERKITSDQVPLTRNVDEVLDEAWHEAMSERSAEVSVREGETPFEARLRTNRELEAAFLARGENPVYFQTEYTFDRDAIRELTDAIAAEFTIAPENASIAGFDPATKQFRVSVDRDGTYLDPEALYDSVMAQLDRGNMYCTVKASTERVFAEMSSEELSAQLGKISSYTTKTTSNRNRNTNIRLSAEAINGFRVEPGATFSFNQVVGQRTERKGYKEAAAIAGGQTRDEIGGGVCQTSSTLFNAVARGNFQIVTRYCHAWPSNYVEKGFDATVNWPDKDFCWKNNTGYPVYIVAWYQDRTVTVELYGVTLGPGVRIDLESRVTKTYEKPTVIKEENNPELPPGTRVKTKDARKGYEVETWQVWYQDGEEISRAILCTSVYKVYYETWEYN